jgi:hypothetical protein
VIELAATALRVGWSDPMALLALSDDDFHVAQAVIAVAVEQHNKSMEG